MWINLHFSLIFFLQQTQNVMTSSRWNARLRAYNGACMRASVTFIYVDVQ